MAADDPRRRNPWKRFACLAPPAEPGSPGIERGSCCPSSIREKKQCDRALGLTS